MLILFNPSRHVRPGGPFAKFDAAFGEHDTGCCHSLISTNRVVGCGSRLDSEKRQQYGWPNWAHRRMKSWPSLAIEPQRRSPLPDEDRTRSPAAVSQNWEYFGIW